MGGGGGQGGCDEKLKFLRKFQKKSGGGGRGCSGWGGVVRVGGCSGWGGGSGRM